MKLNIDTKIIALLAKSLHDNNLTEIEWKEGDASIRLCRKQEGGVVVETSSQARSASDDKGVASEESSHGTPVTSPIVGTVYTSPKPGAPSFITVGKKVKKGQTMFIIEVMKTMNPIISPVSGEITSIDVENEDPVEFGQQLAVISED